MVYQITDAKYKPIVWLGNYMSVNSPELFFPVKLGLRLAMLLAVSTSSEK